jgi:gluconate 2-dehydrogenase gamma chain
MHDDPESHLEAPPHAEVAEKRGVSRRTLLARAALIGAGAVIPADALFRRATGASPQSSAGSADAWETLTAAEAATLEAMTARLIPSDETGPGAREARAVRYIDRALGGALADARGSYQSGLAAVDAYARSSKGAVFVQLSDADQDAVLRDMETNTAAGFSSGAAAFFNLVRAHTIQGTFSDPFYGGNANFAGWDLIAYPGVRLAAAADDQRMDRRPNPVRRSAYDHAMFSKKRPARASAREDERWRRS